MKFCSSPTSHTALWEPWPCPLGPAGWLGALVTVPAPSLPLPLRSPGYHRFLLSQSLGRWGWQSGAPQGVCLLGPICPPPAGCSQGWGEAWSPHSVAPAWGIIWPGPSKGAEYCSMETHRCTAAWPQGPWCFGVPAPGLEGPIYSQQHTMARVLSGLTPPACSMSFVPGHTHVCRNSCGCECGCGEALAEHRGPCMARAPGCPGAPQGHLTV